MNALGFLTAATSTALVVPFVQAKTVLSFSRKANTCDEDDVEIHGTSRVVFAYNNDPLADESTLPSGHQGMHRSAASINLQRETERVHQTLPDNVQYKDVYLNSETDPFVVPKTDSSGQDINTFYGCRVFSMPQDNDYHIISFKFFPDTDHVPLLHHFVVFDCQGSLSEDLLSYQGPCGKFQTPDYPEGAPQPIFTCANGLGPMTMSWAVGQQQVYMPPTAGIPVGTNYGGNDLLLNVHFDMPTPGEVHDNSFLRIYYVPLDHNVRPNDVGVLSLGEPIQVLNIPPGMAEYSHMSSCSPDMLYNNMMNWPETQDGITVINNFFHMHVIGRKTRVHHYRKNEQGEYEALPWLDRNDNYDFDVQLAHSFRAPYVHVEPTDFLQLECIYDSTERTENTTSGLTTDSEMCLTWMQYYPRVPSLTNCWDVPTANASIHVAVGPNPDASVPLGQFPYLMPETGPAYEEENTCTGQETHDGLTDAQVQVMSVHDFDPEMYKHTRVLQEGEVVLHWTYNDDTRVIDFAVEYMNIDDGWAGFGISPSGQMLNSDVAMGWVDQENGVHFADRNVGDTRARPAIDALQDLLNPVMYKDNLQSCKYGTKFESSCMVLCDETAIRGGLSATVIDIGDSDACPGPLPDFSEFTDLVELRLHGNKFDGDLDRTKLPSGLQKLTLAGNTFSCGTDTDYSTWAASTDWTKDFCPAQTDEPDSTRFVSSSTRLVTSLAALGLLQLLSF